MKKICRNLDDEGVSLMTEYLSLTSLLVVMFVIMMFVVNVGLIEGPSNTLKYHSYVDIGNGLSVRMVDLYVIAPGDGTIRTQFDLPDEVAGEEYYVTMGGLEGSQFISVTDGDVLADVAISGIGASRRVIGNTSSGGTNVISYNSLGV